MSKKRHSKTRSQGHSRLSDHRRVGKKLLPPLAQLPLTQISWARDLLPDMLWLDSVLSRFPLAEAADQIHDSLDVLDRYAPSIGQSVLTGLVSSFDLIPSDSRPQAREALTRSGLLHTAFSPEFLAIVANYPECPMHWILGADRIPGEAQEMGVNEAAEAVLRLLPSREKHPSRCRMFPIARLFKHQKLKISTAATDIARLFPRYSDKMAPEDQLATESLVRAMYLGLVGQLLPSSAWPAHFWRSNYRLSPCIDTSRLASGGSQSRSFLLPAVRDTFAHMTAYLEGLLQRRRLSRLRSQILRHTHHLMLAFREAAGYAALDIYDLDRDDILFGLSGRQFHLFLVLATEPRLWVPEFGLMFHRAMADTQIVFSWLTKRNDIALFSKFKAYSLGKLKLQKLHMADLAERSGFDTATFLEVRQERISEEIMEEFLPIELGALFPGVDIRDMAIETDLKPLYDIVYSPSSAELHGEWSSLKAYNLGMCANPLHRMHRLPRLVPDPHLSKGVVLAASAILSNTVTAWLHAYSLHAKYLRAVSAFTTAMEHALLTPQDRSRAEA